MKPGKFQTNGSSHTETDTLAEAPSQGATLSNTIFTSNDASETEAEEVEGLIVFRAADADKPVSNPAASEAAAVEASPTDEAGSEGATETSLTEAPDAFYASYPNLFSARKERSEVIIGSDDRTRINPTTTYPWRAICALRITAQNGSQWIGTGWMVSPRTVITAGHCVFMHDQGGWAKKIEVIPAMNDTSRPYGSGISTTFHSVKGWTESKKRDFDYGAIILPASYRPGATTGYFGYAVKDDAYLRSAVLNLSGYPGDKGGSQQWFMLKNAKSVSSRVITYEIDTFGGQSGAPVWVKIGESRYCVGIHTNGDSGGNSATRIVQEVFNNIKNWKALGM